MLDRGYADFRESEMRSSEKTLLDSRGTLLQRSRTRRNLDASAGRLMLEDHLRCVLRTPVARQCEEVALG